VIPALLAHWLEVSAPAVTMALKRLKRDGLPRWAPTDCATDRGGTRNGLSNGTAAPLIERMLNESLGWSGTRSTRRPSGWSMRFRRRSRPS